MSGAGHASSSGRSVSSVMADQLFQRPKGIRNACSCRKCRDCCSLGLRRHGSGGPYVSSGMPLGHSLKWQRNAP